MIGETLDGKYKLVALLGEGGMGSVYEAQQLETGRRVAVKTIKTEKTERGSEARSRFRRECLAAREIESDYIVQILDSGEDEASGNLYLVMERLDGEDLQRLLDREGALPPDVALRIAGQALHGLATAHEAGVVHRDIKPANLFLARRGGAVTVKVLDFGIAKVRADPQYGALTTGLTATEDFIGTMQYASPEQLQSSKDVDVRTDVWSLGCTLYATLAGKPPHHQRGAIGSVALAICSTPPPALRDRAPWVPQAVAEIVHRALAMQREARTPSADAMLEEIRAILSGGFALRDEMLAGLGPDARSAALADTVEADVGRHVVDVGSSHPIVGDEPTAPRGAAAPEREAPPTQRGSRARRRALLAVRGRE